METPKRVALVGFMGSGKTTIGRVLAHSISFKFIDLDLEIEKKLGKRISDIFLEEGETYFRQVESDILFELSEKDEIVVSCGGGIVDMKKNRYLLKSKFFVIYLDAPWKVIWRRIKDDPSRPKARASEKEVKSLFLQRRPLYEDVAHLTIKCGKKTEAVITDEIKGHFRNGKGII